MHFPGQSDNLWEELLEKNAFTILMKVLAVIRLLHFQVEIIFHTTFYPVLKK